MLNRSNLLRSEVEPRHPVVTLRRQREACMVDLCICVKLLYIVVRGRAHSFPDAVTADGGLARVLSEVICQVVEVVVNADAR
jgi:hypothetical protein